jgi:ParB-like chromosome segregation protein Spo0J
VPIALLLPGESPRLQGHDPAHLARLAEVDTPLPPILVERATMRVIDGTHRLMAAVLRGQDSIEVEFFDGDSADAFLQAVQANVAHGFPLTQADRRAAAERIIATHPHLSDRAIAEVAGLGAKTVAGIRRSSGDGGVPQTARVGRDGRVRPLSPVEGRMRVAELLAQYPMASLREVARNAGVSPATASDVRRRLERGEHPAPAAATETLAASAQAQASETNAGPDSAGRPLPAHTGTAAGGPARANRAPEVDATVVLDKLVRDPSLRHKEEGRHLLRVLRNNAIGAQEWDDLTEAVPAHCGSLVGQLARRYAELWHNFAQALDKREQSHHA